MPSDLKQRILLHFHIVQMKIRCLGYRKMHVTFTDKMNAHYKQLKLGNIVTVYLTLNDFFSR